MKHLSTAVFLIGTALMSSADVVAADPPRPHQQSAPVRSAAAVPAQRWASDEPLRTGMRRIQTVVGALQHLEHGHMDAGQAVAASRLIRQHAAFLVDHCRLDPEPDAALHVIIASLLHAAATIEADPGNPAAVATMREALDDYARGFHDPGWDPAAAH